MNNDIPYLETSAKDNCKVEDVFLMIIKNMLEKIKAEQESDNDNYCEFIVVEQPEKNENVPKSKQCCCFG